MNDLLTNVTEFCHLLRRSGLPVGPGDSLDALRSLSCLDLADREAVYLGLRTVLVKRVEDCPLFETAFRTFFDGELPARRERPPQSGTSDEEQGEGGGHAGYSPQQVGLEADLSLLDRTDRAEAVRSAFWVARRLALRLSRRRRRARRAPRLSMRATVRVAFRRGGVVLELLRTRRRTKPANLVLLLDVSGSMEPYSRFLLQFVHALQSGLPRTHSFAFATQLSHISGALEEKAYEAAVQRAQAKVDGWGGGTRIGACLTQLCEEWAPALLGPRTAVIILSDGLDTGEPDLVSRSLERIARRASRVIWLNPLAGDPRYQPLARGMVAALPHLDTLAPGHSMGAMLALADHLEGLS
jgi:uncharacterized protein with von Willebrand factor type A (vWA) domain